MRTLSAAAIAASLSCLSLVAFADDVPPPPRACPDGSIPETGHMGPFCAPKQCGGNRPCDSGKVCQPRALCMGEAVGGGLRPRDVPAPRYKSVLGRCDKGDGSACSLSSDAKGEYWGVKDGACQTLSVCVAAGASPSSPKSSAELDKATPGQGDGKARPNRDDKPGTARNKPPCSCSGSPADLSISMIGLVMVWLLVRRRAGA
jgi:uncharacterized protein (TIGR03382 family)